MKELLSSEDRSYIVTVGRRVSRIYELSAEAALLHLLIESADPFQTVLSEIFIVTVPTDGGFTLQKLRVWSRSDGSPIGSRIVTSATTHVCLTDSGIVIYTQDYEIIAWDPRNGSILRRMTFLSSVVSSLSISYMEASFSDFLVVLVDNAVCVYDWREGVRLYSLTCRLGWTQDYINVVWTCPTAAVIGGIYNRPVLISFVSK